MIGERLHNPAPPIFDARIRSANLDLSSRGAGRNRELAHYRLAIGLSGYGLNELIDDVAARLGMTRATVFKAKSRVMAFLREEIKRLDEP